MHIILEVYLYSRNRKIRSIMFLFLYNLLILIIYILLLLYSMFGLPLPSVGESTMLILQCRMLLNKSMIVLIMVW